MANKHHPRLVRGMISDRIYVVTRYTEHANGVLVAHTKYDVTDDFRALTAKPKKRRTAKPHKRKTGTDVEK